jgi:putative Mg2+ transporter-C (MgtC) family protein
MEFGIVVVRILITLVAAGLFGLERQSSHKPVGFGTFIFVSIGACALAVISQDLAVDNPIGLLAAIVTGIGFLGAGAMIKTNDKIFGVTTAAGIWLFAVFGLTMGIGEYAIALLIFIIVWIVVLVDRFLQNHGVGLYQRHLTVTTTAIIQEKEVRKILLIHGQSFKLVDVHVDKVNKKMTLIYVVQGHKDVLNALPQKLYDQPWFGQCMIQ